MGGQLADHGTIQDASGTVEANVLQVKKAPNGQPLHTVEVLGDFKASATYTLVVDASERAENH